MKRKIGAKNPTGKLHSRWCNVSHPKPIPNDSENRSEEIISNLEDLNEGKNFQV